MQVATDEVYEVPVLWINLVPPQFPVDRPEQNTQGKGTVTKFPIPDLHLLGRC